VTEVVWPNNQNLGSGNVSVPTPTSTPAPNEPSPSPPDLCPGCQVSNGNGNQTSDTYFAAYQEAQDKKESYKEVLFKVTIFQRLPLRDFLSGLDIKISADVYAVLDQTDYRAVFCYRDPNTTEKGLIIRTKAGSGLDYYNILFAQLISGLKKWEPKMFADLKNVFSPLSSFKATPQFHEVVHHDKYGFMDLTRREASLKDEAGASHYLGYTYFDEKLFIANGQECLQKMTDAYSPQPG